MTLTNEDVEEIREMDDDAFTDHIAHEGEDIETLLTEAIEQSEKLRDQIGQRISDVPADGSRTLATEKALQEVHYQWNEFVSWLNIAHGKYMDI